MTRAWLPDAALGPAREIAMPEGLTIAQIVGAAFPTLSPEQASEAVRVVMVGEHGQWLVPAEQWRLVRPAAKTRLVIRTIPGSNLFASLLQIFVMVAANFFAPGIGTAIGTALGLGSFGTNLAIAGAQLAITAAGGLLINALIGGRSDQQREKPNFAISAFRNQASPNAPVPRLHGRQRYAPPLGMSTWTRIDGDKVIKLGALIWGHAPLLLDDWRLGDTPIAEIPGFTLEHAHGIPSETPLALAPHQVAEEAFDVELRLDRPVDEYGEEIEELDFEPAPHVEWSKPDAWELGILLVGPGGLIEVDDKGREKSRSVTLKVEQRLLPAGDWEIVNPTPTSDRLVLKDRRYKPIWKLFKWRPAVRGTYAIRVTRESPNSSRIQAQDEIRWVGLQTIRPEQPFNFPFPVVRTAFQARSSFQAQGTLDKMSAVASALAPHHDGGEWIEDSPDGVYASSAVLLALRGTANIFPRADETIDWDHFAAWHAICVANNLRYHRPHDFPASLRQTIDEMAAAGRALVEFDGRKWTVPFIDVPDATPVALVSPRTATNITRSYVPRRRPDAYRIEFRDQQANFAVAERIVPRPAELLFATEALLAADLSPAAGTRAEVHSDELSANCCIWVKVGAPGAGNWTKEEIRLTEEIRAPWITDAVDAWRYVRYRQWEEELRGERWTWAQEGKVRSTGRGSVVLGAADMTGAIRASARAKAVSAGRLILDDVVDVEAGKSYVARWIAIADDGYGMALPSMKSRPVTASAGPQRAFMLGAGADLPDEGALIDICDADAPLRLLIVTSVSKQGPDQLAYEAMPAAPELHARLAADVPYAWTGRVGGIDAVDETPPLAPRLRIEAGYQYSDDPDGLTVFLAPAPGSIEVGLYKVWHRLVGAGSWSAPIWATAADAAVTIGIYELGDAVELKATAVSVNGFEGPETDALSIVIGERDPAAPDALLSVAAEAGPGRVSLAIQTAGTDTRLRSIEIFRVPQGTPLDASLHGLPPITVAAPGTTIIYVDGDKTNVNLWPQPRFDASTGLTLPTGWSVAAGKAVKAPGTANSMYPTVAPGLVAGDEYRLTYDLVRNAGTLTPRLAAPTGNFTTRSSSGTFRETKVAVSGQSNQSYVADAAFDGNIDNAWLVHTTPTSVPYEAWDYYARGIGDLGVPGPLSSVLNVHPY